MKLFHLKHYSKSQIKSFPFVYLLVLFPVAQFCLFWVYVKASSVAYAFQDDATGAVTLHHFSQVFEYMFVSSDSGFNILTMMGRSFLVWGIGEIIVWPISLATTYLLYKKVIGHYFFRTVFQIPGLLGSVVWVSLMLAMSEYNGPIVGLLSAMGVKFDSMVLSNGLFASAKTAFPTLLTIRFFMGIVGGSAVVTGAYARIPQELCEAAQLDGISFWGEFFHIALPCSWATLQTLIIFSLCSMFTADGNVYLYTSGTGEPGMATIGYYLYFLTYRISRSTSSVLPYGYASAFGWVITLITVPIVLIGRKLLNKIPTVEV